MGSVAPDDVIEYTLDDLQALPRFIKMMKNSWRNGTVNEFESSQYIVSMKTEFPQVYDTLLTKRNNNWMTKLPTYLETSRKAFVLVGAMHLSGKAGLLNQLKGRGFIVEQL